MKEKNTYSLIKILTRVFCLGFMCLNASLQALAQQQDKVWNVQERDDMWAHIDTEEYGSLLSRMKDLSPFQGIFQKIFLYLPSWLFPSPSLYPGDSFIMPCQNTSLKRPRQQHPHNMWGQEREEARDKVQWREVEMWRAWCYMWVVYITVRWDQVWTHMALQQSRAKLGDADVGMIKQ